MEITYLSDQTFGKTIIDVICQYKDVVAFEKDNYCTISYNDENFINGVTFDSEETKLMFYLKFKK